ncbi:hypothetical protein BC829DRAFT_411645 [Chytridium lagenaria]|nr:hypothetical protein BC829DRAFT_411645 [Chytridium lagenaria]
MLALLRRALWPLDEVVSCMGLDLLIAILMWDCPLWFCWGWVGWRCGGQVPNCSAATNLFSEDLCRSPLSTKAKEGDRR